MGTKNNPGRWDCYANADPDEPLFVLRGQDSTASLVVTLWRAMKMEMKEQGTSQISEEKLEEARECSLALEKWAKDHGEDPSVAFKAFVNVLKRMKEDS